LSGSEELAGLARRHGLRVHVGPIVSTDRILSPAERSALDGALAVDMESAWLADAAGGRPLAVLRVVVDGAGRRLADPRIAVDGVRALRSLRRCSAVLDEWNAQ
jgi:4-hydroxy-3-methylbut-2-enyl diphosphate reductase